MVSIKTPDWVKEHLSDDEDVISRFSTGIVSYYASDRRVLRFPRKSKCDSMPYDQLSITYKSRLSLYVAASLVILVCALCVIAFAILTLVGITTSIVLSNVNSRRIQFVDDMSSLGKKIEEKESNLEIGEDTRLYNDSKKKITEIINQLPPLKFLDGFKLGLISFLFFF